LRFLVGAWKGLAWTPICVFRGVIISRLAPMEGAWRSTVKAGIDLRHCALLSFAARLLTWTTVMRLAEDRELCWSVGRCVAQVSRLRFMWSMSQYICVPAGRLNHCCSPLGGGVLSVRAPLFLWCFFRRCINRLLP